MTAVRKHPRGLTGVPVDLDLLDLIGPEPPRPHGHLEFDSGLLGLCIPTPCTRGWVKTLPEQGGDIFQNSHVPGVPTQPALLPDRKGDAEPRSGRRQLLLKAKPIFSVYEFLP